MRRPSPPLLIVALCCGCLQEGTLYPLGEIESAPNDTGAEPETVWCLDWEAGTLADAGYQGNFIELDDGALVLVADEGDDFSALVGEEALDFRDTRSLVLRSSHGGDVDSTAVATTPAFTVLTDTLWWWQLSEVGDEGVEIWADLLDGQGALLATTAVPAETGGFVPALQDHHDPIDGFPEITYGDPADGDMVPQALDLSSWMGQTVQLRLRQHTWVPNNGFFTLIDDICLGNATAAPSDDDGALGWDR